MLANFEKYQEIWYNNLKTFENARDRLNKKGLTLNFKINAKQHEIDLTLQDRVDFFMQEKQSIDGVLDNTFRNQEPHPRDWVCTLRNSGEYDHIYDGVRKPDLKSKGKEMLGTL